jgi:hypothetical protein
MLENSKKQYYSEPTTGRRKSPGRSRLSLRGFSQVDARGIFASLSVQVGAFLNFPGFEA